MSVLNFRRVSSPSEFEKLASAWRELAASTDRPAVMLDPQWLVPWWSHYGGQHELSIGLFEKDGQLVGLAPFFVRSQSYPAGLKFRRLEFLGAAAGAEDAVGSEYLDVLARPGFEQAVIDACTRHMCNGGFGDWQECVLEAMTETALGHALAPALSRRACLIERSVFEQVPYVVLPARWDDYLATFSKKRRQALRYAVRDFERWAGPGRWRRHHATDTSSLEAGLKILVDLHSRRWVADGEEGAFSSRRFRAFHEAAAREALAAGTLDLNWITVGDEPVAVQYNLIDGKAVRFYQCGRNPDVPKQVRLGIFMLVLSIQDAIARGCSEFDFLGGEAPYKSLFATHTRTLMRVRAARWSAREGVFQTLKAVRRVGRQLMPAGAPF